MPRGVRSKPPVAVASNTIVKSIVPSDRQWMVYDLVREWVKAQMGGGTIPTGSALLETHLRAEELVSRILSHE